MNFKKHGTFKGSNSAIIQYYNSRGIEFIDIQEIEENETQKSFEKKINGYVDTYGDDVTVYYSDIPEVQGLPTDRSLCHI